jgi:DUF971 family protein
MSEAPIVPPNLPWPTELKLAPGGASLCVSYDSGERYDISAELLRVESPSAEVKGHGPGQEVLVLAKENVRVRTIEPVGTYAARLIFDDGHSTGLFTWGYLLKLGREHDALMSAYREKVAASR